MKKLLLITLLSIVVFVAFGQYRPIRLNKGVLVPDSSVFEGASTFQDTIYYTGQTATDTLLWMGANSTTKALYLDTTETSSFALQMPLQPIDSFMMDVHNNELKWYYEEGGNIKYIHGWAENISDRYQQLMAGIEISLRYTLDNYKQIQKLENQILFVKIILLLMILIFVPVIIYLYSLYKKGLR